MSFSGFCAELGLPLKNVRNSWCAISHEKRQAVFTIWDDQRILPDRSSVDFTSLADGSRRQHGAKEFSDVINRVIEQRYDAYGILCWAKDPAVSPRQRQRFDRDNLIALEIAQTNGKILAYFKGLTPADAVRRRRSVADLIGSAIDDISPNDLGNDDPEYKRRMAGSYVRDGKVRKKVLRRARGYCEYCEQPGFLKRDGTPYLETHHVISLSEQGSDKPHNVIALCANDHRQAHFGENWLALQAKFLEKLNKYRTDH